MSESVITRTTPVLHTPDNIHTDPPTLPFTRPTYFKCFAFQSLVLLSGQSPSVAEALECVTASDVLVASEGTFSRAAVALSNHVKVCVRACVCDG